MTEDPQVYRALGPIYISSIQPLLDEEDLYEKYNITTIISVTKATDIPSKYNASPYQNHLQIPIDDMESEIVISEFERVNKIIFNTIYKSGTAGLAGSKPELSGNAVLIHCQSGVSRSVTFACAYLMRRHNLNLKLALHAIRRNYPERTFEPNDGFKLQLEAYKESGWVTEPEKLRRIGGQAGQIWRAWRMKYSMTSMMNPNDQNNVIVNHNPNITAEEKLEVKGYFDFKCGKCRTVLANSKVFMPHIPPVDENDKQMYFIKNAYKSRRVLDVQKGQNQCTHVFVEPLKWMRYRFLGHTEQQSQDDNIVDIDDEWDECDFRDGEIEGKLNCFKCHSKVGGWSWQGGRCSCGKWIIPDIHLQRSKLIQTDENGKIITLSDPRYI